MENLEHLYPSASSDFSVWIQKELRNSNRNRMELTHQCLWRFFRISMPPIRFFIIVQLLSRVQLLGTPWTTARQASLSFTISLSLLTLVFFELMMPSNHFIFCHPLLLPSVFPSIRVFSNELALCIRWPKCWSIRVSLNHNKNSSKLTLSPSHREDFLLSYPAGPKP